MKNSCIATGKYLIGVRRQLFEVGLDPNKHNMTGIVPLPTQDDDIHDSSSYSNENVSWNDRVYLESDEDDYNSDCSLGSLNSLYLSLKDGYELTNLNNTNGEANKTQLRGQNSDTSRIDETPENNIVARIHIPINGKFHNAIKDGKPPTKLKAIYFYGKQVNIVYVL